MAKRKEETPPAGAPAWMATFSDLMNLLLCFFVMLFSMSTLEEAKLAELVASMNNAISIFDGGATAIGDGILISSGVSQLNELDEYINSTGKTADSKVDGENLDAYESGELEQYLEEKDLQANEEIAEIVEETLKEYNIGDEVDVSFTSQYVQLTMNGALLFDSGKAELKGDAASVLDRVGVVLERYSGGTGTIEILGHTDNVPMSSARYASNEELSDARALSVFYYLQENTALDPRSLKHAGMGERDPIADNSTPEGRSRNRRVEIRIYNPSQG